MFGVYTPAGTICKVGITKEAGEDSFVISEHVIYRGKRTEMERWKRRGFESESEELVEGSVQGLNSNHRSTYSV